MAGRPSSGATAAFWQVEGGKVRCGLCPHRCLLGEGATGACRVRRNDGGAMVLPFYGRLSALADDPIEKKPLYHFLPGSRILSAGFFGCNLRCPFCQNWEISQGTEAGATFVPPEDLAAAALRGGFPAVAFTYSEPCVHAEYLLDAMRATKAAGIRNVLVTNGCLEEAPALALLELADAANVDLKCWDAGTYRTALGGDLEAVRRFIDLARQRIHVEVTTLLVPGISDQEETVSGIASFLAGLSPDIPLHLSAYHPAFRYDAPPLSPRLILRRAAIAEEKLRYVYVGNLDAGKSDSHCPRCGAVLARRRGYAVVAEGLALREGENGDRTGGRGGGNARCATCFLPLPFVLRGK